MSIARRSTAILLVLALAACGGGGSSPSPSDEPGDTTSPTPAASTSPTATAFASASASPPASEAPSRSPIGDAGEPFTCDLPVVDPGTAPIANIVDVRVGTHDGYDRVVFEFEQGTPEFTIDRAEPPFSEDASGMPLEVEGESFLGIVMRGGTKQTDAGESSYDGPTEFEPDFATLVHAVEAGDFERQSTWYLGLVEEACVRVLLLDGPPRLVIDLEH
jgi:hypothetical protein